MCVICHKPMNVRLPSADVIRDMWDANPDGAGVMWRDGRKVSFIKGFMKWDPFAKWLEENRKALDATECALHFRITTHGGTNPQNSHPFPLDKGTRPDAQSGRCKAVLMHNGILPLTPRDGKYSDTAEYTLRAKESGDPMKFIKATSEFVATSSRLCVFSPKETLLVGNWKQRGDGCNYSNLNFEYLYGGFGFGSYFGMKPVKEKSKDKTKLVGGEPEPVPESRYDYYWDDRSEKWKNRLGHTVSIDEVDSCSLSYEDEVLYWEQYAAFWGEDYGEYEQDAWDCGRIRKKGRA